MNKIICLLLSCVFVLSAASCSSGGDVKEENTPPPTSADEGSTSDKSGGFDVEAGLFNVTLTIPSDFMGEETTQESLDKIAEENGYKSVTLNADGSATYVVTKAQHEEMVKDIANSIDESLNELVGSEEYPNIVSIETNSDYSKYTVTLKSETVGLEESFAVLGFYIYSGMYHTFNGTEIDNVNAQFVNEATGAVIEEANSNDAE